MIFLRYKGDVAHEIKVPCLKQGIPSKFVITHNASQQQYVFTINSYTEQQHQIIFDIVFGTIPFAGEYSYILFAKQKELAKGLMLIESPDAKEPVPNDFFFDYEQKGKDNSNPITEEIIDQIVERVNETGMDAWIGTRAEYEALSKKDPNVWYYITDEAARWDEIGGKPDFNIKYNNIIIPFSMTNGTMEADITNILNQFVEKSVGMQWDDYQLN